MSKNKTNKTGIGNLDTKMEMLDAIADGCIENYHSPIRFMASADSLIQALRNFTFALQSNKGSIPDFEAWYAMWQEVTKSDSYMSWLNKTRVKVVHEDTVTTASKALLQLDVDHTQTLYTRHYDIMATSEEMIKDANELANQKSELRHAVGTIHRYYFVDVNGKQADIMDVLASCLFFIKMMYADLIIYLEKGELEKPQMEQLEGNYEFPTENLAMRFKLRDGSKLNEVIRRVEAKEMLKGAELARQRYGDIPFPKIGDDLKKADLLRAHFRLAKHIFEKDGYHVTMMHVHGKDGWSMVTPFLTDRSEKIAFFRSFSSTVEENGIDEIIFTSEMWTLQGRDRVEKHIRAGKEVRTLRNKGEVLAVQYINNKGVFLSMSSVILRDGKTVKLDKDDFSEDDYKNYPLFYPIFEVWGLPLDKQ